MLLPLSAFEATTALPSAAVKLTRSRISARRLLELAGPNPPPGAVSTVSPDGAGRVAAVDRTCVAATGGRPRRDRSP
jgi:ATP-binding cassette subfamily C protein CydC